jgi:hypothetical protein
MQTERNREELKLRARDFLQSLEKELNAKMPPPPEMREIVRKTAAQAKDDPARKHMRQPENAFLYHYALPIIFDHMQIVDGIGAKEARNSLLSEFYRNMGACCLQTPARKQGHPFTKILGAKPADIIAQWTGDRGAPLRQACPDFAFRDPFPFRIVFEGKYFEANSAGRAKAELVTCTYQAFYYRALPHVPPRKSSPAWNYDFACLLLCDASKDGSLKAVWNSLKPEVRRGFWDGANVYVMILRGTD